MDPVGIDCIGGDLCLIEVGVDMVGINCVGSDLCLTEARFALVAFPFNPVDNIGDVDTDDGITTLFMEPVGCSVTLLGRIPVEFVIEVGNVEPKIVDGWGIV